MEPAPPLQVSLQSPLLQEELMELQRRSSHLTSPSQVTLHLPLLQEVDSPDLQVRLEQSAPPALVSHISGSGSVVRGQHLMLFG